jgi:hypothetical protein
MPTRIFSTQSGGNPSMIGCYLFLGIILAALPGSAAGQTFSQKVNPKHIGWQKYTNHQYRFSFWYPGTYQRVPFSPPSSSEKSIQSYNKCLVLLQRRDNEDTKIEVRIDTRSFDSKHLSKGHAPTGYDPEELPDSRLVGNHIFYLYGPGGGGVAYPDQWLVKVDGKILEIYFDGPYVNNKTPGYETKEIEVKLAETFRTF